MAELVHGEKEHSDWFPEGSEFCYTGKILVSFFFASLWNEPANIYVKHNSPLPQNITAQ